MGNKHLYHDVQGHCCGSFMSAIFADSLSVCVTCCERTCSKEVQYFVLYALLGVKSIGNYLAKRS